MEIYYFACVEYVFMAKHYFSLDKDLADSCCKLHVQFLPFP